MCVCVCVCVCEFVYIYIYIEKKTKLNLLSEPFRSAWCAFQRNPFMSAVKKKGKKEAFLSLALCLSAVFRFNVFVRSGWLRGLVKVSLGSQMSDACALITCLCVCVCVCACTRVCVWAAIRVRARCAQTCMPACTHMRLKVLCYTHLMHIHLHTHPTHPYVRPYP